MALADSYAQGHILVSDLYANTQVENTATKRRVFDYYPEGRTVKEITELMGVKESTIRFHNRNIYSALGITSLKQLLRCAAILAQDEEAAGSEA